MPHNPTDVVLQSFEDSLGQKAQCTDDIKLGVKLLPISYALKKKYISLNQKLAFYIWLDIDNVAINMTQPCDSIEERIENENIPTPTLIIKNKDNNKGHVAWRLKRPVCMTVNGHTAPQDYIKSIQKAFSIRLGADLNFTGTHVKNPLSDCYRVTTHDVDYALDDLMSVMDHQDTYLATSKKELNKQKEQEDQVGEGESRNCDLFNLTRCWAYTEVQHFNSFDAWYERCNNYVTHNNKFTQRLPLREERSIAMSIAKWTWKNRHVIKVKSYNRPKLDKKELKRRQREAVLRTQANRVKSTLKRLESAIDQLIETGRVVTKTALQLITELSYKTIQRYWQRLQDKITTPNTDRLKGNRSEAKNTLQGASTGESNRTLSATHQVYRANTAPIELSKQNNNNIGRCLQLVHPQTPGVSTLSAEINTQNVQPGPVVSTLELQAMSKSELGLRCDDAAQTLPSNQKPSGRKLNRHEKRYLNRTLDNLIEQHSVVITTRVELTAQCEFVLTQHQQLQGIDSFRHRVNIIAKLIKDKRWRTPIGFYQHSEQGRAIKAQQRQAEAQRQQEKENYGQSNDRSLTDRAMIVVKQLLHCVRKVNSPDVKEGDHASATINGLIEKCLHEIKALIEQGADRALITLELRKLLLIDSGCIIATLKY